MSTTTEWSCDVGLRVYRAQGLGFRDHGLGFRVSGNRFQGLVYRVQRLRFRVSGLGFRVLGFRVNLQDSLVVRVPGVGL